MQVVIPMAGIGSRFKEYGFKTNKYLLPIDLELHYMIEKAIVSLDISGPCTYFFIINEENGADTDLRKILHDICIKYGFSYSIKSVDKLTEGPASTVYTIVNELDMDCSLFVSNSDQVLEWNFAKFLEKSSNYDGCVLTYKPAYPLTIGAKDKHSFIHLNSDGEIDECREKIVLSENALVGVHYFKTARHFKEAYEYMVRQNMRAPNGEFYLSLCYQSMIENGHTVGYCELDESEQFYPVGEPGDYFDYLYLRGGYVHDVNALLMGSASFVLYKDDNICVEYCATGKTNNTLLVNAESITDEENATMTNCFQITMNGYVRQNKTWQLTNFVRGWFIGNFEPNIVKTDKYEVALLSHCKGEKWDFHYHRLADEINFLVEGRMLINERVVEKGSLFIIQKNQLTCPNFLENCKVLCIKVPSVPSDKYSV
jgi:dTDP-glucose pyrophosphorylase